MSLKEQLLQDMKDSMKNKDVLRKDTIQIVRAGVLQIEKDNKIELDDPGVMDVISKELKKRYDVLPDYERSGRQDSIDDINRQIQLLKAYLPEPLSEEEISAIVIKAVEETGASSMKDMGKLMAFISPSVKGRADSKMVSDIVKKSLSK